MKLINIVWTLIICINTVSAQWKPRDYFIQDYKEKDKIVSVNVDNHFASNTIVSSFAWNYLRGNYISEAEKNQCIANFNSEQIRVGERFNSGFSIYKKLGNGPYFFGLEFSENIFYETRVHNDLFSLLFKGNNSFEGKAASLSPLDIRLFHYSAFKVGMSKQTDRFSFYCKLAYLGSKNYLDLKSTNGLLYTEQDGRSVDITLNLVSLDASAGQGGFLKFAGSGIQTEFGFDYKFSKRFGFYFGLDNLGYLKWKGQLKERIVDTSYVFEGVVISGILDSFSLDIKDAEDLRSRFIHEKTGLSKRVNLPVLFNFGIYHELVPGFLDLGLKYQYIQSDYADALWSGLVDIKFSPKLILGAEISYGGYGKFNGGVKAGLNLFNHLFAEAYFSSLNSLVTSKEPYTFIGGAAVRLAF